MNSKIVDIVSIVLAIVLIPMVLASAHAYWTETINATQYMDMWKETLALVLGFVLRGFIPNQT